MFTSKKYIWLTVFFGIIVAVLTYSTYSGYKAKIKANENNNWKAPEHRVLQELPGVSNEPGTGSGESLPEFELAPEGNSGGVVLEKPISGKSILMVVAFEGFKDKEYFTPKQYFFSAGAETVLTASNQTGDAVGTEGGKVPVNLILKDVNVSDFDAIVFVGGSGVPKYLYNEDVYRIASNALNQGKVLGAIAEAQVLLKNATGKIVFANSVQDADIFAINIIDILSQ